MQNAYFTTEPYAVFPDVTGVDFNIEDAQNLINDNPDAGEYAIGLDFTKADITIHDLGREAFPNLLGTFSTNLAPQFSQNLAPSIFFVPHSPQNIHHPPNIIL